MSMNLRCYGSFNSLSQVAYEVKIYQEGYTEAASPIGLCADPLEIEWPECDKLEPVQSSNATLQLYSDDDRQFVDLYTVVAGSIRLDVYRDGSLYWSGTLDPELYEEPFAYKKDYGVKLTFADFAILDRLEWEKKGFMSLREVLEEILVRSGIYFTGLDEWISTTIPGETGDILDTVSVNCANFYDEDGEAMSLREVLDEWLRPFALRLQQKGGRVLLYDLNHVYTAFTPETVQWDGDNSVLSVDKVYNNVKVKFSPYEETALLKGEVDPASVTGGQELTVWIGRHSQEDEKGFTIRLSDTGKGIEKSSAARYFAIQSIHSGDDSAGVAWTVKTMPRLGSGEQHYVNAPTAGTQQMLLRVPRTAYIGHVPGDGYQLKVSLDLLYDVRYNPFEETSEKDKEDNGYTDYDHLKNWANFAYVPVKILLRDEAGNVTHHFENYRVKESNSFAHPSRTFRWISGDATWNDCWLAWYQGNRKNETGLGGWQTNKRIIGYYRGEHLPVLFDRMGSGEYIPLPSQAGWIEFQVGTGVELYDYKSDTQWQLVNNDIEHVVHWVLYRNAKVELVDKYGNAINTKDEEHSAWINRSAKEGVDLDTVLGTMAVPSPTARGQLFRTSDRQAISTFERAGQVDLLERLLCGTAYSNYAGRNLILSGTACLLPGFGIYTDKHEPGRYLLLSETQRLADDESIIAMAQFDQDNYEGIEYNG